MKNIFWLSGLIVKVYTRSIYLFRTNILATLPANTLTIIPQRTYVRVYNDNF